MDPGEDPAMGLVGGVQVPHGALWDLQVDVGDWALLQSQGGRAGWAMGGVKDRYLKLEKAGDQYVGQCEAGLNQLKKEFVITPPYFDFADEDKFENEVDGLKKKKEQLSLIFDAQSDAVVVVGQDSKY